MRPPKRPTDWGRLFAAAAAQVGGTVVWLDESGVMGRIDFAAGGFTFFHLNVLDLNAAGAMRLAKDKGFTNAYLRRCGHPVPLERLVFSDAVPAAARQGRSRADAPALAAALGGYPLFVKPLRHSQGAGVRQAYDAAELDDALAACFRLDDGATLQPPCPGDDVRVVVLDGHALCAYRRRPRALIGDGVRTLGALLTAASLPADDPWTQRALARAGWTLDAVPPSQTRISLAAVANLSAGGTAEDLSDRLAPDVAALAERVAVDMGLRFCGVDLLVPDPLTAAAGATVLEVNGAPGLDHFIHQTGMSDAAVVALYARLLAACRDHPSRPSHLAAGRLRDQRCFPDARDPKLSLNCPLTTGDPEQ